eukprot:395565-Alexandrium_andersonii.AAC.1
MLPCGTQRCSHGPVRGHEGDSWAQAGGAHRRGSARRAARPGRAAARARRRSRVSCPAARWCPPACPERPAAQPPVRQLRPPPRAGRACP